VSVRARELAHIYVLKEMRVRIGGAQRRYACVYVRVKVKSCAKNLDTYRDELCLY
jgi:hypothetical protein